MESKFNEYFKNSYRRLFEEEAPEETAEIKDIPRIDPQTAAPTPPTDGMTGEIPPETESELPDPKEAETVTIDLLNMFIDFVNLSDKEKINFLKEYGFTNDRANSDNYKEKLDALKAITKSDFPEAAKI